MSRTLLRSSLRHVVRHPWQVGLSILGIGLGVGVVVAIDLATESARRAFLLSAEAVMGRATHQVVGGPRGLDEGVYARLVRWRGPALRRRPPEASGRRWPAAWIAC